MKKGLFFLFFAMFIAAGVKALPNDTLQKDTVTLPLYNLYHLSKYISIPDLGTDSKNQIYNRIVTLLRTPHSTLPDTIENAAIQNFMRQVSETKLQNIISALKIHTFSENNIADLLPNASEKSKSAYNSIAKLDKMLLDMEERNKKIANDIAFFTNLKFQIDQINITSDQDDSTSIKESKQQIQLAVTNLKTAAGLVPASLKLPAQDVENKIAGFNKMLNDTNNTNLYEELQKFALIDEKSKKITLLQSIDIISQTLQKDTIRTDSINELKQRREQAIVYLANIIYEENKGKISVLSSSGFLEAISGQQSVQQLIITSNVQSAEQNTASSFRLPSESEMINAMAIFLATRAKQEAMIWFLDRLKKEVHNPLVFDAFPKTIELLKLSTSFTDFSFGAEWRYALSEDLVKMPKSLVNSPWMEKMWFGENADEIKELVEVGSDLLRLIQARYSYRDIIRYFYLNNPSDVDSKIQSKKDVSRTFTFLYVLVNELYTIDNTGSQPHYRLLTLEEINGIDVNQWEILASLIKIKYGPQISEMFLPASLASTEESSKRLLGDVQSLNRSISAILLSLSQFDKLNQNTQQEEKTSNGSMSVWKNLYDVVRQVDPVSWGVDEDKVPSIKKHLASFESILTLYEDIYNKNFINATKTFLNLSGSYILPAGERSIRFNDTTSFIFSVSSTPNFSLTIPNILPSLKEDFNIQIRKGSLLLICDDTLNVSLLALRKELSFINYYQDAKRFTKLVDSSSYPLSKSVITYLNKSLGDTKKEISFGYQTLNKFSFLVDLLENPYTVIENPAYTDFIAGNLKTWIASKNSDKLITLTSFFSDVFSSTDATTLAKAIDKHVLPPTSYIIKRKTNRTITFNGYVGFYGGHQWHMDSDLPTDYKKGAVYGVTAPIGITLSNRRFGLFLQGLDLGNIVGHYLWETTSTDRKNLNFKVIVSPGANLMWNIPRSPFVLYTGVKWIPLERREGDNDVVYNQLGLDLIQANAGIKIDIPIFTIAKWNH